MLVTQHQSVKLFIRYPNNEIKNKIFSSDMVGQKLGSDNLINLIKLGSDNNKTAIETGRTKFTL